MCFFNNEDIAEIIHRGGVTDEEGEVFTNKYLTAVVRQ